MEMAQRLKVPGGLQTRAAFEPSTFNAEQGTVEVVFTTGARGLRGGIFSPPYYEELEVSDKACDLSRLNNGAPLLDDHGRSGGGIRSVLGVCERAWIAKGEGRALVRFSDREEVKPVKRDVQNGILRHVSVGYTTEKMTKVGDEDGIPILRAVRWTPAEISQTPIGFDDRATVRGRDESDAYEVEVEDMTRSAAPACTASDCKCTAKDQCPDCMAGTCTCATCCTRNGACEHASKEKRAMSETEKPAASTTAADPTEQLVAEARAANARAAEADGAASARAAHEAAQSERTRIAEITRLVRMTKLGEPFAEKLIRAGTSLDKVREIVLEERARADEGIPTRSHLGIEAGDDARDKFVRGACASIFQRAGTATMIAKAQKDDHFASQFRDISLDPGEFRGLTLLDLARESLERRGQSTRGLHGEALVRRALNFRGDQGMNTTSDFAILLETAVNKTFLGAYAFTPVTWRRWCSQKSVKDFRTSTFYRPGSFGKLDKVTEGGEVLHKNIPDGAKATLTAGTVGNIIGVTRRAIVNDDMGVFNSLAVQLGQAAALSVEIDAYALVTANSGLGATMGDTKPVFDAAHANIGGSGAMSVTTWDSAQAALAAQMDVSGAQILDLSPAIWLGPKGLFFTAKKINAVADPTANINASVVNPAANMVRDIVSTARLTGTRHYFLADPGMYPVFAVGFIDGQEAPRIESEQSFEYDGVQWRVILDYGTAVLDYRGAITSPGA